MNELRKRYLECLRQNKVFTLTEDDLSFGTSNEATIKSIDDLIMVHMTNYMPAGSIKTPKSTNKHVMSTFSIKINGEDIKYPFKVSSYRNTVHTCLNGVATDHAYRTVEKAKYAVLLPLATNKEKIVAGTECDLFSEGDIEIRKDSYILCLEEDYVEIKKANPEATVVVCQGDSVKPYVNVFLSQVLGYKYKEPTELSRYWDHGRGKDCEMAYSIIQENGWEYGSHNGSKWSIAECREQRLDILIQVLKIIIQNKLLYNLDNFDEICKKICLCLNSSDILTGYSFSSEFFNESSYNYICDSILKETGLDLKSQVPFSDITGMYDIRLFASISSSLAKQIRVRSLLEKEEQGILSEKEKIELLYNQNRGDYFEFLKSLGKNIEKEKFLLAFNNLDRLENRKLSDLSIDELDSVLNLINFKVNLGNNVCGLSVFRDSGYTEDESYFEKPTVPAWQTIRLYAGLDFESIALKFLGKDAQDFYDTFNSLDFDDMHQFVKETMENVDAHLIVPDGAQTARPDISFEGVETVSDLFIRVTNYVNNFNALYSGQNVKFDRKGNFLDTPELTVEQLHELKEQLQDLDGVSAQVVELPMTK